MPITLCFAYNLLHLPLCVMPTSVCCAAPVSSIVSPALTCSKKVATLLMRVFGVDMWFDMVHVGMISTTGVVVVLVVVVVYCLKVLST